MKGNEALGEAAIQAGCRYYFGYPITPQSELLEYMAVNLPKRGGVFVQSESEIAGIGMLYGASASGKRAMTSSSSPGISLMQETISYLCSAELPGVIVNVSRGGPGLGRIRPAQSDYFQATKGGGHGDYHLIVLAPASVQEMAKLATLAFDLSDKYRNPVMILGDGIVAQMMESVDLDSLKKVEQLPEKPWAVTGPKGRGQNLVLSAPFTDPELEVLNQKLTAKYQEIAEQEVRYEEVMTEDADVILVAFGIVSRFSKAAIAELREQGIKVGLIRPITLFPFPYDIINKRADKTKLFLDIEMNEGQMLEDVKLAINGKAKVEFFGGGGGKLTPPNEIAAKVKELIAGGANT
ncbi:MAG: 2-oxoglutarate ferredoxin oxidoreductase subunit alpha [Sporomusa sp.]|jgi:2-oxoglutarate ferredoxin oxidoreductase subunit alpha|nr:2-oxoglutarate ferredoxin oxidoreductase subunit alpha [Sporomusa sp.]